MQFSNTHCPLAVYNSLHTWTKSLWPASIMFSCASEHNNRYGLYILFTCVFLNISVETLIPQNDKCWQGHPIQNEMQTGVLIMFIWVVKSYTLLEQLLVFQGTCCPHPLHPWSNQVQTTPLLSQLFHHAVSKHTPFKGPCICTFSFYFIFYYYIQLIWLYTLHLSNF